ncbi:hypothetical protein ZHAS_00021838 [Anopheles sinensis]|uniref:Uncharacterized protein n=1 Tax=Anopheles sinensis TaxID=74873 RepID=A0A084WTQ6_ANOSI|nr:hypothetical protein ZHAS_00021838 [Anopheles sinensis]
MVRRRNETHGTPSNSVRPASSVSVMSKCLLNYKTNWHRPGSLTLRSVPRKTDDKEVRKQRHTKPNVLASPRLAVDRLPALFMTTCPPAWLGCPFLGQRKTLSACVRTLPCFTFTRSRLSLNCWRSHFIHGGSSLPPPAVWARCQPFWSLISFAHRSSTCASVPLMDTFLCLGRLEDDDYFHFDAPHAVCHRRCSGPDLERALFVVGRISLQIHLFRYGTGSGHDFEQHEKKIQQPLQHAITIILLVVRETIVFVRFRSTAHTNDHLANLIAQFLPPRSSSGRSPHSSRSSLVRMNFVKLTGWIINFHPQPRWFKTIDVVVRGDPRDHLPKSSTICPELHRSLPFSLGGFGKSPLPSYGIART